jgi:hypothetical protein
MEGPRGGIGRRGRSVSRGAATQAHLPTTPLCGGRKRSSEIFPKK